MPRLAISHAYLGSLLVATGALGVDAGATAGFDIYSRLDDGLTVANTAVATLSVNGTFQFYVIDLLTGKASKVGDQVVDIAVPLDQ